MQSVAAPVPSYRPEAAVLAVPAGASRLRYLDNIKIVLVAGVIAAHAATTYIGGGAWEAEQGAVPMVTVGLAAAGLLGAMFWLGLFFLMAGFLAPPSLERHGPRQFLRERLLRLGIPFVTYIVLIMPAFGYLRYRSAIAGHDQPATLASWLAGYYSNPNPGPMWFVGVLLLFSAGYAAWWHIRPQSVIARGPLRPLHLAGLAVIIAFASFGAHLVWPVTSHQFLDLHLWQWPQYLVLFGLGIASVKPGWLTALPDRLWQLCGVVVVVVVLGLAAFVLTHGSVTEQINSFAGGWSWQALLAAGVEGLLAVGGSLWVLEFFRRYLNHQGPWTRQLSRSAYGAFALHVPIVGMIALALQPLATGYEVKVLIVATTGITLSYALAWLLVVRLRLGGSVL